jgi:hypothetical protein
MNETEFEMDMPQESGDELAQVSEEQLVANLASDVRAYERALERALKDKKNYQEQLDLDEKIWAILEKEDSFNRITEPSFEFEKDPEYWKLQRLKNMYKIRESRAVAQSTLKQFDDTIAATEEALEGSKRKLEKFSDKKGE